MSLLALNAETGSYGKWADDWTMLYCRNVSVGYKANVGDGAFLSASRSNVILIPNKKCKAGRSVV